MSTQAMATTDLIEIDQVDIEPIRGEVYHWPFCDEDIDESLLTGKPIQFLCGTRFPAGSVSGSAPSGGDSMLCPTCERLRQKLWGSTGVTS